MPEVLVPLFPFCVELPAPLQPTKIATTMQIVHRTMTRRITPVQFAPLQASTRYPRDRWQHFLRNQCIACTAGQSFEGTGIDVSSYTEDASITGGCSPSLEFSLNPDPASSGRYIPPQPEELPVCTRLPFLRGPTFPARVSPFSALRTTTRREPAKSFGQRVLPL